MRVVIEHIAACKILRPLARPFSRITPRLDRIQCHRRRRIRQCVPVRAPPTRRILRGHDRLQRKIRSLLDLSILASQCMVHPHQQPRRRLRDIIIKGGVVVLVRVPLPHLPTTFTLWHLFPLDEPAIRIAPIKLRCAILRIKMPRVIPAPRGQLRARHRMRCLHRRSQALLILRRLISIQHRHPHRRSSRRLNPDRVRSRNPFRLTQREVSAVAIHIATMRRCFGMVERNGLRDCCGNFSVKLGCGWRRNAECRNQNDDQSSKAV